MKLSIFFFLALVVSGCANKYPGWEFVRVDIAKPLRCNYVLQEACTNTGAACFAWFKKRAIVYGGNFVHITDKIDDSAAINIAAISQTMTVVADYYNCPN